LSGAGVTADGMPMWVQSLQHPHRFEEIEAVAFFEEFLG
jgi:hypothetical protein